jgi:hypothetical protein
LFQVWVSEEPYKGFEQFFEKFSAGESFSEQARHFLEWLVTQTEGLDSVKLALKLQKIEDARTRVSCFDNH